MAHCLFSACGSVAAALVLSTAAAFAQQADADDEAAYTRAITERAQRIVDTLEIEEDEQAAAIRDLIAGQYRALREIHDARDARLAEAEQQPGDSAVAEAFAGTVRKQAALKIYPLHRRFVAQLSARLTPEQVEQVKDGMTYGVVPITYERYLELLPELTDQQRTVVRAHLLEAREHAMDAGSAERKHWWFGKYKGRINNYLSAEGYDLKQAERQWRARQDEADSPAE